MKQNNIFKFATKELSQDAFICWLVNWINIEDGDPEIKELAYEFIEKIVNSKNNEKLNNIIKSRKYKVEIKTQYKKIDVLLKIENDNQKNESIFIIIEDKIKTLEHNFQIKKYKSELLNNFDNKYRATNDNLIICYYKPFEEGDIKNNKDIDFLFSRDKIIDLLKKYNINKYDYLKEYFAYLNELQKCAENINNVKEEDYEIIDKDSINHIIYSTFFKNLEKKYSYEAEMKIHKNNKQEELQESSKVYWGSDIAGNGKTWWCNIPLKLKIEDVNNENFFEKNAFLKINFEKNLGISLRMAKKWIPSSNVDKNRKVTRNFKEVKWQDNKLVIYDNEYILKNEDKFENDELYKFIVNKFLNKEKYAIDKKMKNDKILISKGRQTTRDYLIELVIFKVHLDDIFSENKNSFDILYELIEDLYNSLNSVIKVKYENNKIIVI